MYKFFISQKQIDGETATITGEDVNHIANVLRLKQPDKIILCDKDEGKSYISEIMQIEIWLNSIKNFEINIICFFK